MADLQSALHARLSVSLGHSRVYWNAVPQNADFPYVRLSTVSDPRPQHLTGYDTARQTRIQADVFALEPRAGGGGYGEARAISETIIAAVAQPATVSGVKFGRTKAEGPRDMGEDVAGVGYVYRLSLDLLAEHSLA